MFAIAEGEPLIRNRDLLNDTAEVGFVGEPVESARVEPGDVLISMDGDFRIARWRGSRALLNQRMCSLRARDDVDEEFLVYQLPLVLQRINAATATTTVKHLSSSDILQAPITLPPIVVQRGIVRFLDEETAKIDALIEKKRLLTGLLRADWGLRMQSLLFGADRKARSLTDSGVEWLGRVPLDWRVLRAGLLFRERDERREPDLPQLEVSLNWGVILRNFESDRIERVASDLGDQKIARAGDLVFNRMRMWQGAVGVAPEDGLVSPDYTVAVPAHDIVSRYVQFVLKTQRARTEIDKWSHGMVRDRNRLYWAGFRSIRLPVPPVDEQHDILRHIDTGVEIVDSMCSKIDLALERLREYRSALITAAVTGQIDVGSAA